MTSDAPLGALMEERLVIYRAREDVLEELVELNGKLGAVEARIREAESRATRVAVNAQALPRSARPEDVRFASARRPVLPPGRLW